MEKAAKTNPIEELAVTSPIAKKKDRVKDQEKEKDSDVKTDNVNTFSVPRDSMAYSRTFT